MEKKIYIVTSGNYSDYSIDAVFSTKEKAVDYVEQHGTYFRIEEYDIGEEVEKKAQLWVMIFSIKDNKLLQAYVTDGEENKKVDTCYIDKSFTDEIRFYVYADSMNSAVKIASERFAAVKANEYIWIRLTRPCLTTYGTTRYERFNIKTNEFI